MNPVLRLVKHLALTLALAGCAALTGQSVAIPPQPIGLARMPSSPLTGTLALPDGTGPFPVVILLHGCGGISDNIWAWQRRVLGWGYAVLVLDSFAARGVRTVCAPENQAKVTASDRTGDVVSAALFLRGVPRIDGTRIGVIGFSHGGATAARVTERQIDRRYPKLLKAVVDYYGSCGLASAHGTVPLLALAGEDDDWGFPALSCRVMAPQLRPDQPFELRIYPHVAHAFDNPRQSPATLFGHRLGYDEAAASDSYGAVQGFLVKYLAGAPPGRR